MGKFPIAVKKPVLLQVHSTHVPSIWNQTPKVREIENILRFVGATKKIPLYLIPDVIRTFHSMHLKTKLTATHGAKIEKIEPGRWHFIPHGKEEHVSFEVSGEIPKSAKEGDIVLVKVTAHHPKTETRAARSTEFLEVIYIRS